jgi:hypothetical protein
LRGRFLLVDYRCLSGGRSFDGVTSTRERKVIQTRPFGSNNSVLEIVKVEGGLEEVTKIQRAISPGRGMRFCLDGCEAESGNVVDG